MDYIKGDSLICKVLHDHPETEEVFAKHGMHCRSCMGAADGTVKDGALMHSVCLASFLAELNKKVRDNKTINGDSGNS
ncbi:MAG: DUF1858 domain-containing protein [Abditibacteriota bacterium]|nr:DUF1858 domain-containing protein [Abditibacteriota bacterium]